MLRLCFQPCLLVVLHTALAFASVQKIGADLYAYISSNESSSNSVFLVGDSGVLVVDTGLNNEEGRKLLEEIRKVSPLPVRWIVNTHYHPDHRGGNLAVGSEAVVISTTFTRNRVLAAERRQPSSDYLLNQLAGPGELTLFIGGHPVRIYYPGPAHTRGDLAVYFPDQQALATGDLFLNGSCPYMDDGDLENWIAALDHMRTLPLEHVVPGHFDLAGKSQLQHFRDYLAALQSQVKNGWEQRLALPEVQRHLELDAYQDLRQFPKFEATFADNAAAYYHQLEQRASCCGEVTGRASRLSCANVIQKCFVLERRGMEYVNLGSAGVKVSRVCFGCMTYGSKKWREWVLEEEEGRKFIKQALDLGINFFDTADMYSIGVSEEILGRALRDLGPAREKLVVATKVFFPMGDDPNQKGLSRKHIMHAIDASLRRLGMDYVDLYQIHRFDYETSIEETLEALHDVIKAGKARYIGASSMFAWQFAKMLYTADRLRLTRFVTMQNHYNLIYREEEREMAPLCREEGIGMIPWSPLARGLLAGSRRAGTQRAKTDEYSHKLYTREADDQVVEAVAKVAQGRGVPPAQVALSWLLHKPGVTAPIVGATKPHHLTDAVAAVALKLSSEEISALESVYVPHPVLGHH